MKATWPVMAVSSAPPPLTRLADGRLTPGAPVPGTASHEHDHDEHGNHPASACSTHLAKAFEQYSAYLESARCVCRAILERGWATTCCAERCAETAAGVAGVAVGWDRLEEARGLERVSLAVDGMTCSGCGTKMERTLRVIHGVRLARTNFVVGSAEFSLDTSVASADQVIRAAARATGFHCVKLSGDDQTIDVLASGPSARALTNATIPGVTQAVALDRQVVRVTYDPAMVGARALMQSIGGLSRGLAPPCDDPLVSSGRKRLVDQLIKTTAAACFTVPVAVLAWSDGLVDEKTEACVALALATVVQLIAVPAFYWPAVSALVHGCTLEMDMLIVISITAAYVYSVVAFAFLMAGRPLETKAFFETSTLLTAETPSPTLPGSSRRPSSPSPGSRTWPTASPGGSFRR